MKPEIVVDAAGRPRWFVCTPDQLEQAVGAIPAATLRSACSATGAELELGELRQRVLQECLQAAERVPAEIVKPLVEAAEVLGLEPRALRYEIESGKFDSPHAVRRLKSGGLALAFRSPPRRWPLIPRRLQPDPRVGQVLNQASSRA